MSTTNLVVTDASAMDLRDDTDSCPACQHPRASHDTTSSRFCAATVTMGATRRCVCRVETLDVAGQAASSHRFGHASTVPRGV